MRFPIIGDIVDWFISQDMADQNKENYDRMLEQVMSMHPLQFSRDQYNPDMTYVPDNVGYKTIQEDPELRRRQLESIDSLNSLSQGKISAQRDLDRYKAIQDANAMAKANTDSALQQAQARGVGGGGLEFAMRQQAGQDAANRLQQADMSLAAQAALERMQATGQLNSALSNMRGQDYQTNSANTNIINQFNQMNSLRHQEAMDKQAMLKNQAMQYNMDRNDRNNQLQNQSRNNLITQQVAFQDPQLKEQLQLKYGPLFRLNDAFSNTMGNMVASGMGGGMGGDVGGAMGGGGGGMWSNMGSMIGSQAGQAAAQNMFSNNKNQNYGDAFQYFDNIR